MGILQQQEKAREKSQNEGWFLNALAVIVVIGCATAIFVFVATHPHVIAWVLLPGLFAISPIGLLLKWGLDARTAKQIRATEQIRSRIGAHPR